MKSLKQNQLGPWCSYCEPKTTRANLRKSGMNSDGLFACIAHRERLREDELEHSLLDKRCTEADHQTWGRL